ncbi:MAG: hypothetical protein RL215_2954, partial [Planctomycetota bacterium]
MDFGDLQAEVDILSEESIADGLFEVAIGGGDDADIGLQGFATADAFEGVTFEDAEETCLNGGAHFTNFIKKQGSAIGLFEAAWPSFHCAGECAFFVSEEFAFEQAFAEGGAVDANEGAIASSAAIVNLPGDEFLAATAFAADQDIHIGFGDEQELFAELQHGGIVTDERLIVAELTAELLVEAACAVKSLLEAVAVADCFECDGELCGCCEGEFEVGSIERIVGIAGVEVDESQQAFVKQNRRANHAGSADFSEAVGLLKERVIGEVAGEDGFAGGEYDLRQAVGDAVIWEVANAVPCGELEFGGLGIGGGVGWSEEDGGDGGDSFAGKCIED